LGGRLDATNVLSPVLTITTDISRDHVEILGRSLRLIATEKAGIIKPGVSHLVGVLPPEAADVMRKTCRQRQSVLHRLSPRRFKWSHLPFRFAYRYCGRWLTDIESALPGRHQIRNAALVLRAVELLEDFGLQVSENDIRTGLHKTVWPGRFQVYRTADGPAYVLDVAHNAAGMLALVDPFQRRFPGRRVPVILGFVKRKEHQAMVTALGRIASAFHLVPLATCRSIALEQLVRDLRWPCCPIHRWGKLATALKVVAKAASPDDIILVAGSHFLVGEFLKRQGWS